MITKKRCLIFFMLLSVLLLSLAVVSANDTSNVENAGYSDTLSLSSQNDNVQIKSLRSESNKNIENIKSNDNLENEINKTSSNITNIGKNKTTLKQADDESARYSVVQFIRGGNGVQFQRPWLMNDSTWVFSLGAAVVQTKTGVPGNYTPAGYNSIPPGIYKRIALTDDYEIIHPVTNENILPYIRTAIYNYMNYPTDGWVVNNDLQQILVPFSNPAINYTNSSNYTRQVVLAKTGSNSTYVQDYVNETYNLVKQGNAVSSSGMYKGSDRLSYQFYLYTPDEELNNYNYFDVIGFKIFTKIDVINIWNDTNHTDKRPASVTVNLKANGNNIQSVSLSQSNNWSESFSGLPVYEIYDDAYLEKGVDYQQTVEELNLVNIRFNKTTTGTVYYNITANGVSVRGIKTRGYAKGTFIEENLPKYDSEGNEIEYAIVRVTSSGKNFGSNSIFKFVNSSDVVKKNVTIQYNSKSDSEIIHVGLYRDNLRAWETNLSAANNWTFSILRQDADTDYTLLKYNIMNVIDYSIDEEIEVPENYNQTIRIDYVGSTPSYTKTIKKDGESEADIGPFYSRFVSGYQFIKDYLVYDDDLNPLTKQVTITNDYYSPLVVDDKLKVITGENTIVSNETYSSITDWNKYNVYYRWNSYGLPFLMNDTTWAYCMEPSNSIMPNGKLSSYLPGIYKRITLTDEKIIHPVTGEDILPYLRTAIYYHFNDTENFTVHSGGKPQMTWIMQAFTLGYNYTDFNDTQNQERFTQNGPQRFEFVREIMDLVKSGKGINNTGSFYNSDYLSYQFYLYFTPEDDYGGIHYQNIVGFNIFTKINVTKTWDDKQNEDKRPESINVDLLADNQTISTANLNQENNWTYNFTDLPVYKIYQKPVTEPDFTITDTNIDGLNFTLKIEWEDETQAKDNIVVYPIQGQRYLTPYPHLYEADNWTGSVILPKYDKNGNEITNYNFKTNAQGATLIVTNQTVPNYKKYIKVTLNNETLKEKGVTIALSDDTAEFAGVILNSTTLEHTFDDLDVFDENNNIINYQLTMREFSYINIVNYTVSEPEVKGGYTVEVYNNSVALNPLMPTKQDDSEKYVSQLINPLNNLSTNFTIINSYKTTNITVNKIWNDLNNTDGLRPNNITVILKANGEEINRTLLHIFNDYNYTFTNLPIFDNGKKINYTVEEILPNRDEYVVEIKQDKYKFTIKNTHIPDYIKLNVSKIWDDVDDADGLRPTSINVTLYANGIANQTVSLTKSNNWTYTFDKLPRRVNGKVVNYTIEETPVPTGYNVSYNSTLNTSEKIPTYEFVELTGTEGNNGLYNIYVLDKYGRRLSQADLTVYDSNGNEYVTGSLTDGKMTITWPLSEDFIVNIKYSGDETYEQSSTKVTEDDLVFHYVSEYDPWIMTDGNKAYCMNPGDRRTPDTEIDYDAQENPVYMDYTKIFLTDDIEMINPLTGENVLPYIRTLIYNHNGEINIAPIKDIFLGTYDRWAYDYLNTTRLQYDYPDYVPIVEETVNQVKSGNGIDNWGVKNTTDGDIQVYQFYYYRPLFEVLNIPFYKFQNLLAINYTTFVQEAEVTINNTHVPMVNVTVTKVWDDNENIEGARPDEIQVYLYRNGNAIYSVSLSDRNNWTYTFKNLLKYDKNNTLIQYSVNEYENFNNYNSTITHDGNDFIITNKYIPLNLSFNVTKIWNDTNNTAGLRPNKITVYLLANNEIYSTAELNESNNWSYQFTDLPKYIDNKLVTYTVQEENISKYNVTYGEIVSDDKIKQETNISLELHELNGDETNITGNFSVVVKNQYGQIVNNGTVKVYDNEGNIIANGTLVNGKFNMELPVNLTEDYVIPFMQKYNGRDFGHVIVGLVFDISVEYLDNDNYYGSTTKFNGNDILIYAINGTLSEPFQMADGMFTYCVDPGNYAPPNSPYLPYLKILLNGTESINNTRTGEDILPYLKTWIYNHSDDYENFTHINSPWSPFSFGMGIFKGYYGNYRDSDSYWSRDVNTKSGKPLSYFINQTIEQVDSGNGIPDHGIINVTDSGRWEYQFYIYYPYDSLFGRTQWQRLIGMEKYFVPNEIKLSSNITNTLYMINVTKVWYDNENQDGKRWDNIIVELMANDKHTGKYLILNSSNNWTDLFIGCYPYDEEGNPITYNVSEVSIPIEYTNTTKDNSTGILVINKDWTGIDNIPESLLVGVFAGDENIKNITLTADDNWTYVHDNLPVYDDEQNAINYSIKYQFNNTNITVPLKLENITIKYVINNSYIPENTTINVTKVWNDTNNTAGLRPTNITVGLYMEGILINTIVLNESNNWMYTFANYTTVIDGEEVTLNLSKYQNGTLVHYTVDEINETNQSYKPDHYTKYIKKCCNQTMIINTHIPKYINITVEKQWNDDNDHDGLRPDEITIRLKANGQTYRIGILNESNNWKYTFTELPEYQNGEYVTYTLEELNIPDGYESAMYRTLNNYTFVNNHTPEYINLTVKKVWNDSNNRDHLQPTSVDIELLANGVRYGDIVSLIKTTNRNTNWTHNFTNLPKIMNGEEVNYTINEITVLKGYNVSYRYTKVNDKLINVTITNTHIPEYVKMNIQKIWDDGNNQDGLRPNSIKVTLGNGTNTTNITIYNSSNWKSSSILLNKYDSNGNEFDYSGYNIIEIQNYSNSSNFTVTYDDVVITQNVNKTGNITEYTFTFTNHHTPANISINVSKNWMHDVNNMYNTRPSSVDILLLANNNPIRTFTLSKANNWTYFIDKLPRRNGSKSDISYSLREINTPNGYTPVILRSGYGDVYTYNITNYYYTNVTVQKIWDDNNNSDLSRPPYVTARLYRNGEFILSSELLESEGWKTTFAPLLVYDDEGNEYVYSVDEIIPDNYIANITNKSKDFTIVNTFVANNLNITKIWADADDANGLRPTEINVTIYANNLEYKNITLTKDNNWTLYVPNLPKYINGTLVEYTVKEVVPEGYNESYANTIKQKDSKIPTQIHVELTGFTNKLNPDSEGIYNIYITDDTLTRLSTGNVKVYDNEGNLIMNRDLSQNNTIILKWSIASDFIVNITYDENDNYLSSNQKFGEEDLFYIYGGVGTNPFMMDDGIFGYCMNWTSFDPYDPVNYDWDDPIYMQYVRKALTDDPFINPRTGENVLPYIRTLIYYHENEPVVGPVISVFLSNDARYNSIHYEDESTWWRSDNLQMENLINDTVTRVNSGGAISSSQWVEETASGRFGYQFYYYRPFNLLYNGRSGWQECIGLQRVKIQDTKEYVVNITNTLELINLTVNKVWDDNENADGKRDTKIIVELLANGEHTGKYVVLKESNKWTYNFTYLDKFDATGNEIKYTVDEVKLIETDEVDENNNIIYYTESYVPKGYNKTIHDNSTALAVVTVDWTGVDNVPGNLIVQVFAGSNNTQNITLTADANWTYVLKDLPVCYDDETAIVYNIKYTFNNTNMTVPLELVNITTKYVITNTHYFTSLNVTKVWDDSGDQDGIRPKNITVELLINGGHTGIYQILNESNGWSYNFTNLDKFDEQGHIIKYTVDEVNIPQGYTNTTHDNSTALAVVTVDWTGVDNVPDSLTVQVFAGSNNTQNITLTADANWTYVLKDLPVCYDDETAIVYNIKYTFNNTNMIVSLELVNITTKYVINNTHTTDVTTVNVTKQWIDNNNQDHIQPDSIIIGLYKVAEDGSKTLINTYTLTSEDNWMHTFEDYPVTDENNKIVFIKLPKYENGKLVVYDVDEINETNESYTPDGYTKSSKNCCNQTIIINTHIPEVTSIEITKVWIDGDNQDNLRPGNITVNVFADGKFYMTVVVNVTSAVDFNTWKYLVDNLPKYNGSTTPIVYTVKEVAVNNYTTVEDGLTITNNHIPEVISIPVEKVWDDNDNQDRIRPDSITVVLTGSDGSRRTLVLTGDDWSDVFENLPKYYNGEVIKYTVTEDAFTNCANYTNMTKNCSGVIKVINTHVPETFNITVYKAWNDSGNRDGLRVGNVTVHLLVGDVVVDTGVICGDEWTYTFRDLPKYDNGTLIVYTVAEVNVPTGYNVSYNQTNYTVINTHELFTKNISVVKVWNDSDTTKDRPTEVTVMLFDGENNIRNITLTGSTWKGEFTNLPVYREGSVGEEIIYTVKELGVDNYVTSISNVGDNYTIVNTHVPELVNITVNKVWDDSDNQDGLRGNVTVVLKADGVAVANGTVQINSTDNWSYTFRDLPKYVDGKEVTYTVEELNIPAGYNVTIDGFKITNKHIPELINITVNKTWNDNNNQDGFRNNITIILKANGEVVENCTVQINDTTDWTYTFRDLAKYANGKEIVYTLEEDLGNITDKYTSNITRCNNTFKVVNSHTPELVNKTVTKEWNDNDNQDNIRPKQVVITLKSNGIDYQVGIIKEANGVWKYTFNNLPKYENGSEIVYTVEETIIPNGYTESYDQDSLTITNTHELITKNITAVKVWDDNEDNDGARPDYVTVELYAGGDLVNTTNITKANNWAITFTNLTVYKAGSVGKEIVYTIKEQNVTGYTTNITQIGNNFTITNTHNNTLINLSINKTWDDDNNHDGLRPDSITVRLRADGEELMIVEVKSSDNYKYTFTNLTKYNNKKLINYTIEEVNVPNGYTAVVNGTEIINTHTPEVTSVNVTKIWNDADNQDGVRAGSVTVNVMDGNDKVASYTLNEENGWKHTFENLPKFKNNGTIINYTVTEDAVKGYNTTIVYCEGIFKVINSHITVNTTVSVEKVWSDSDNQDGVRPVSVTVKVTGSNGLEQLAVLDESNGWKYTFNNLPMYYNNGTLVEYVVDEVNVPEGYTKVVTNSTNAFVINNTHTPEVTNVTVTKVWNDSDNQDGIRPASVVVVLRGSDASERTMTLNATSWTGTFTNLPKYDNGKEIIYTVVEDEVPDKYNVTVKDCSGEVKVINTHIPEVTNITVTKVWDDNNNQDGVRPDAIFVQVNADGKEYQIIKLSKENNWIYTITDLAKYAKGKVINYTVLEADVPANYTAVINGTQVINTHIPEVTTINVTKVWDDSNNNDRVRPDSIKVNLLVDEVVIDTITIKASDNWTGSFINLSKYADGKEIKYVVEEADIPANYTAVVNGTFIINTHIPEVISLNLTKVWDDNNDNDAIRPNNITINLLADGEVIDTVVLSKDADWKYTFDNLLKYHNGKEIVYTIKEVSIPEGYTVSITNMTITNTHEVYTKEINVTKKWNDNNNNDNIRPHNITVILYADGTKVQEAILTEDNGWKHTFTNLTVNKDGKAINYTLSEVEIPGYLSNITATCCGNFIITNTHEDSVVELNITKVWNDSDDNDRIRPDNITVEILANGQRYSIISINATANWRYTLNNLPEYLNGTKVNYTIREINVAKGYTSTINGTQITNTHIPEVTQIKVIKIWNDSNNNDGIRPVNVTVSLFADGNEVQSALLSQANNWTYVFDNITKYTDGKEIVYTVSESIMSDKYDAIIKNCSNTFKIINTHIPEVTNITVIKVWNDNEDNDAIRPTFITINLLADSKVVITKVITKEDNWKYTFTNLPKYADGKEILYSIEEVGIPAGYDVAIENMTITNTHEVLTKNITVTKVWNDSNNNDNIRPESITVNLFANGKIIKTTTLNADDDWKYNFTDLPVYENGVLITYSVSEDAITGYDSKIVNCSDNFKIINAHEKYLTSLNITKVWIDDNNKDGVRPDSITVFLLSDGEVIDTVVLTKENNWKYTFDNLIKYNNTKEIKYTIQEVVPNNYTVTYNQTQIINTHVSETKNVTVVKVWNDSNNNDGLRPTNVTINLLADSNIIKTIVLSQSNNWTYTFTNLDVYNNSKEITYTIEEENVPNAYTVTVKNCFNNFKVINTHILENTSVEVRKVWNDSNNNDGLRPTNITIQLYADSTAVGPSITLDELNNWTYTFNNLAKYNNSKEIMYTVKEVDVPFGYSVDYNMTTITNTHQNITKEITVTKEWYDSNDNDRLRPKEVQVVLYAHEEVYKTITLNAENNWTYTFKDLPVYDNAEVIVYTIDELDVPEGYDKSIIESDNQFVITNNHTNILTNLTVNKVWIDDNNNDNVRPDHIEVQLYANGQVIGKAVVLCDDNNWTYTFENLTKYSNGQEINYYVNELNIPEEYQVTYQNNTIINTHNKTTTQINVIKVWDDTNNNDAQRPNEITIQLYADGIKYGSVIKLNQENNWRYSFNNLAKYNNGKLINYTVDEVDTPQNYTKQITKNTNTYTITNTHIKELVNISVTKVWLDDNNNDGLRPNNVTIVLYANNDLIVNTTTLSGANKWTYTFENLPKYDNGKEIIYTVDEVNLTGTYAKEITGGSNNFTITNKHVSEITSVNVTKVWIDEDNKHNLRPTDVVIDLYVEGQKTDSVKLNEENNWTYCFNDLPKYNNGKLVNYTVDEVNVSNYTKSLENNQNTWTITNALNYTPLKFLWAWKLINFTECYKGQGSNDDGTIDSLNHPIIKNNAKVYSIKGVGKYPYNKKYSSMKRFAKNKYSHRHSSYQYKGCRVKYRLFVYLYRAYFFGNMTYSDFIAAMQQAGITMEQYNNWNSEGVLTVDYDSIDEVPDSIQLSNSKGDVPTSSDTVDKSGSSGHDGVMDSGEVEVEVE